MSMESAAGWCAPSNTYGIHLDAADPAAFPDVKALRGGILFTVPTLTPASPEDRERWAREQAERRAVRKAAGGEWRYAIRVTDEDGDVQILDGSNVWDEGTVYLTADEALENNRYETGSAQDFEVVRRWVADPPEWEKLPDDHLEGA